MRRPLLIGVVVAVALVGGAVAAVVALRDADTDGSAQIQVVGEDAEIDYDYVIPAGTQDAKLRGETVEIMPARLEVEVGETIRIRNDDEAGAFVGIFYVGAGEVVSMEFTTPGTLSGVCEFTSEGEFTIDVRDV